MLRFCLLIFLLCYAAGFALLFYCPLLPVVFISAAALTCFLGLAALFYFLLRLYRFRLGLDIFLRQALSGKYKPGAVKPGRIPDELASLERQINKFALQLQDYDNLRASRVAIIFRVMDYVTRNIPQALILANIEKKSFSFNPSAQELFAFEQEILSFDSILSRPENALFKSLFERAVIKDKVSQEGEVSIEVPIRKTRKQVFVNITPFKDKEEEVKFAVIFVDLSPA